jgi:hypothetical protein
VKLWRSAAQADGSDGTPGPVFTLREPVAGYAQPRLMPRCVPGAVRECAMQRTQPRPHSRFDGRPTAMAAEARRLRTIAPYAHLGRR